MKIFDTLYTRNSNGKINEWKILAQDEGKIAIGEGLIDGTITWTYRNCKPKNVGKMNETTAYEQACNEAQSRWQKKLKQGYKPLSILGGAWYEVNKDKVNEESLKVFLEQWLPSTRTDANNLLKPMKAQPYFKDDGSVRISFPCFGQPKLNGFRVMARWEEVEEGEGIFREKVEKVVFRSKEGLRYDILEHIENNFTKDMFLTILDFIKSPLKGLSDIAFDGEMYIHREILSEISSAVRKRNNKTPLIKFFIFDIAVENVTQSERFKLMNILFNKYTLDNVKFLLPTDVQHNEHAQRLTDMWITQGFEGGIFRDFKAVYQFGSRPKTMVKLKRSKDKEFIIKDVVGGDNAPELGVFICIAENGETFKVNPEGSHEVKKEYLLNKDKYIGKLLTVRFFEYTKNKVPFHSVGVVIRDYE